MKQIPKTSIAIAASLLLLLALGVNFYKLFTYKSASTIERSLSGKLEPFEGSMKATIKSHDPSRQTLIADLELSVQAVDVKGRVTNIAFSPNEDPVTGDREFKYFEVGGPGFVRFERARPGADIMVDTVDIADSLVVPLAVKRQPILYPFDRYAMSLKIKGCVNSSAACLDKDNLFLRRVEIDFSALGLEPGFTIGSSIGPDGRLNITLKRNGFLRLASMLLFAIALLFFGYLVFGFKRDDLFKGALGYFGALWALRSLIVPKAITIFPTMVDYVILTIFCVLFVAVFFKYTTGEENVA